MAAISHLFLQGGIVSKLWFSLKLGKGGGEGREGRGGEGGGRGEREGGRGGETQSGMIFNPHTC